MIEDDNNKIMDLLIKKSDLTRLSFLIDFNEWFKTIKINKDVELIIPKKLLFLVNELSDSSENKKISNLYKENFYKGYFVADYFIHKNQYMNITKPIITDEKVSEEAIKIFSDEKNNYRLGYFFESITTNEFKKEKEELSKEEEADIEGYMLMGMVIKFLEFKLTHLNYNINELFQKIDMIEDNNEDKIIYYNLITLLEDIGNQEKDEDTELRKLMQQTKLYMSYGLSEQTIFNIISENRENTTYIKKVIKSAYKLYDKQDEGIFSKNPTLYANHKLVNIIAMIFMVFGVYQFSIGMWYETFLPWTDAKIFIVLSILLYMWHSSIASIIILVAIISSFIASIILGSNIFEIILKIFLILFAARALKATNIIKLKTNYLNKSIINSK